MTSSRKLIIAAAMLSGGAICTPALAQFQKPEDAIKYRQSAFTLMGNHFARVAAMAQGRVPFDAKVAADNAALAATLSKLPFAAFGEGTDKGMPNRAKPEVWKDAAKFKAASEKMIAEVAKLETAAKGGTWTRSSRPSVAWEHPAKAATTTSAPRSTAPIDPEAG